MKKLITEPFEIASQSQNDGAVVVVGGEGAAQMTQNKTFTEEENAERVR